MNRAALDGAMEPLDPPIDEYAPHIKQFLQDNTYAKAGSVARGGKLYYIPYIMEAEASEGRDIRRDWLDKLGLHRCRRRRRNIAGHLKAFRAQDPTGSGKKDEGRSSRFTINT
ncbi:hypothetical protein N0M98_21490 [Paenibacillus doosanensis]|nr:hypothetical protein [Paenibacillus doosanensis]